MDTLKIILRKYNLLGWPLISLVLSVLLLVFVIFPQVISFKRTNDTIAGIKQRVDNLNTKAGSLSAVDTKVYQDDLKLALIILPEEKDIPEAVGQIQSLIANNKLKLNGISFAKTDSQNTTGLQSYPIKIDVSGNQTAMKDFINSLKEAPLITKVTNLEVSGTQNDTSLDSSLTLSTYYQAPPTTLGDLEKPIDNISQADINLLTKIQQRVLSLPLISSTNSTGQRGKSNPFQ